MDPGNFSRACYGLAPRGPSRNRLGAGLNDGWTVGAAPRWRWSRTSKSSFGRPARVTGRLPEPSIPHDGTQTDQAGQPGYSPGNQSSISRAADSGESDPCTRLS